MSDAQDRRLPPTARRLAKARGDGDVARSRDLAHFAAIAVGGAVLVVTAPMLAAWVTQALTQGLKFDARFLAQPEAMTLRLRTAAEMLVMLVVPIGAIALLLALAVSAVSGGWNFTWKPLAPNFGKLNPFSGLMRMFSKAHLVDTLKACLLAVVLGTIGYFYLRAHVAEFHDTLALPLPAAIAHTAQALLGGLVLLVLALGVFAAIDVPLQRFQYIERLKMSRDEVKQEQKELEGNVEVKAKVRARMREIARRRMLAAVPTADLVVMNPTHYAVALKYDDATMAAPRVVAKGADLLAMKIRDLARDAKVPVLQSPPLARALYAHAEVDQEIPARLFAAVAQVLAYVYQLRAALAGRGAMPPELGAVAVPDDLDPHRSGQPMPDEDETE